VGFKLGYVLAVLEKEQKGVEIIVIKKPQRIMLVEIKLQDYLKISVEKVALDVCNIPMINVC